MIYRLCNGRFATPLDSERDHARHEIARLMEESEKWYRAWVSAGKHNSELFREVLELREIKKKYEQLKSIIAL